VPPSHESTGDARAFPSTQWSRLLADPAAGSRAESEAFATLARRYWRPVAAYIRARHARTDEDARDAAQEFFLWMLEGDFLSRADPARGRFRGFLKTSLANFLHDAARRRRTLKRGGAVQALSLHGSAEDAPLDLPDLAGKSPEQALDDLWRKELLAQATSDLEAELEARGKALQFRVFDDYFMSADELDYAAVASRYGISTVDVSNYLAFAKKRFRAHLRSAVLETVRDDDDLRAELAWLFDEERA